MRYAMIMAGGAGTRLWPMSRADTPKQLLPFINGRSLLEIAGSRLDGLVPTERQYICTAERFRPLLRERLPAIGDEQILGEPMGRDTMNAVGLTAAILQQHDADAIFAVLTADHIIEPVETFHACLTRGFELVEQDASRFVTFAITPTFPATGYGYVQPGAPIESVDNAHVVDRFVEKPPTEQAAQHLIDAGAAWNSGMFIFHAQTMMDAIEKYEPQCAAGLREIASGWVRADRAALLGRIYPTLKKVSIDHGIMERASNDPDKPFTICSVAMNVSWLDVGSWTAFAQTLAADEHGNRAMCSLVAQQASGITAVADDPHHTIAVLGCENLIVVRTADATFVAPNTAEASQQMKKLVEQLPEALR